MQGDEEVAASPPLQMRDALALDPEDRPRLRPGLDPEPLRSVEGLDLDLPAERRLRDRDVQDAVEVLALSFERIRWLDLHADDQITGRATGQTRIALPRHAKIHPLEDAGGDVERDRAGGADAALSEAVLAPIRDLLARPTAREARRRRHHGPEDAPPHALNLTRPTAASAGDRRRARLCADPGAARARRQPLDLHLPLDTEDRLAERETNAGAEVLATADPRSRSPRPDPEPAAEEHVEQVLDVGERRALGPCGAELVVAPALRRIGEDLVGTRDLLEPLLIGRVGVHVGVQRARELAVGGLDLGRLRIARDAEDLVQIADRCHRSMPRAPWRSPRGASPRRGRTPSPTGSPSGSVPRRRSSRPSRRRP